MAGHGRTVPVALSWSRDEVMVAGGGCAVGSIVFRWKSECSIVDQSRLRWQKSLMSKALPWGASTEAVGQLSRPLPDCSASSPQRAVGVGVWRWALDEPLTTPLHSMWLYLVAPPVRSSSSAYLNKPTVESAAILNGALLNQPLSRSVDGSRTVAYGTMQKQSQDA